MNGPIICKLHMQFGKQRNIERSLKMNVKGFFHRVCGVVIQSGMPKHEYIMFSES